MGQPLADLLADLVSRLQSGEQVDLNDCIRGHPEYAEQLAEFLPAMLTLADLGHSQSSVPSAVALADESSRSVPCELGDFRIVREIGRGGMGIVYEAEQLSLGRRVALKVLPFAAMLDPRQMQRFQNEARAAASLKHANIVQVYSVGCERGVHYYAMEFVEGQSLAELIRAWREEPPDGHRPAPAGADVADEPQPPSGDTPPVQQAAVSTLGSRRGLEMYRSLAHWAIQAAEALEHAHQMGVVHRDIKPANLMVDARGHLWITDFGLAHVQADVGITMTGDVLGTLRYMSPEQAGGKKGVVDHHTDIYSLGATLYELLTLHPPFRSDDRRQLLREILNEEPPAPRQLDKSVPIDLQTIVLKTLSKEPQERYATAQDLADDLRRFLDDQPLCARPPSLATRAVKWSRRHRPAVRSAMAAFVLTFAALGVATVLIAGAYAREKTQRQLAVQQERLAERQKQLAIEQQRLAEAATERERKARLEAERQRRRAEANLRLAMDALDQIFLRMTEASVSGVKKSTEEHNAALLRGALDFYHRFAEANKTAPELRPNVEQAYRKVVALYSKLSSDRPSLFGYRRALASAAIALAGLLETSGRFDEAEKAYGDGLRIQHELAQRLPTVRDFREELATTHTSLARSLEAVGQTKRASEHRQLAGELMRASEAVAEPASPTTGPFLHFKDSDGLELVQDAIVADDCLRPSPSTPNTFGAAWLRDKQFVAFGFETTFTFRMGREGGGGLAFVIQNHEVSAVAGGGSGMGYGSGEGPEAIDAIDRGGIPNSLAVEFDPAIHPENLTIHRGHHISVQTRGKARNSARPEYSLGIVFPSVPFHNGRPHVARIRYVPDVLSVYLDDLAQPILTVPVEIETTLGLDEGRAWAGFTAATFSENSPKEILTWQFKPLVERAGPPDPVEWPSHTTVVAAPNWWLNRPAATDHAAESDDVHGERRESATDSISEEDLSFLNRALAFYEQLASLNSDDPDVLRDVGRAYWRTADIRGRLGRPVEAFQDRVAAVRIWGKLAHDFPDVPQHQPLWQRACLAATVPSFTAPERERTIASLSSTIQSLGDTPGAYLPYFWRAELHRKMNAFDLATADYGRAIECLTNHLDLYPEFIVSPVRHAYASRADAYIALKQYKKASADLKKFAELTAELPPNAHDDPMREREISIVFDKLSHCLYLAGHEAEAKDAFLRSQQRAIRAIDLDPSSATHKRWLANLLSVCAIPEVREPKRAMQLALAAAESDPCSVNMLMSLGLAYYRNGDWDKAAASLEQWKADYTRSECRFYGYVLAMTYWQLGKTDKAHQLYNETELATAHVETMYPHPFWAKLLRQEAAGLMGLAKNSVEAEQEPSQPGKTPD